MTPSVTPSSPSSYRDWKKADAPAALRSLGFADLVPASAGAPDNVTEHERLVDQAQKWVAQTFYGTVLKQMHDSPFKSDIFSGGRGGQAFSSLYDQHLTERMARASGNKLVDGIVRRVEARAAYARQAAAKRSPGTGAGEGADTEADVRRGDDVATALRA